MHTRAINSREFMTSARTQHLYSYAGNSPTNFVDPTGHRFIGNRDKDWIYPGKRTPTGSNPTITPEPKPAKKKDSWSGTEEEKDIYNEWLIQSDILSNDIDKLRNDRDVLYDDLAILEEIGLKLCDRCGQRDIGDIFIEIVNIAFVCPKFCLEGMDAIVSAGYSANSFFGGDILANTMRQWDVELRIGGITGEIVDKIWTRNTYDMFIEKYGRKYGYSNE